MASPTRIGAQDARARVLAGKALLVCAYDDVEKCRANNLEGSISFAEFRRRAPAKNQEVILYCA